MLVDQSDRQTYVISVVIYVPYAALHRLLLWTVILINVLLRSSIRTRIVKLYMILTDACNVFVLGNIPRSSLY